MNRKLILALILLAVIGSTLHPSGRQKQGAGVGGSAFHKNDITYSTEVITPHVPWATKLPGGPIKGFFIPSISHGRDMVELMQRLSLQPTTVSIDRNWDVNCWGIGDYYGHEYRGDRDDFQTVYSYVEKDLTGDAPFEVMVIPGLNGWSRMTRATRDAIIRRVENGAGLVLLHPFVGDVKGHPFKGDEREGDRRIWELSPLTGIPDDTINDRGYPEINQDAITKGKWEKSQTHFITDGLPLELLPEGNVGGSFYKYSTTADAIVKSGDHPVVAVKNYGKGRVVALGFIEEGFTPQSVDPVETKTYWDYWEYQYSLLARSIMWAARRESNLRISSLSANDGGDALLRFGLETNTPRNVEIEVSGKSEFGQALGSSKLQRDLQAGNNIIEIPAQSLRPVVAWAGGRQIFDLIIRDPKSGATLDWGAATFTVPKRALLTLARPAVDVYRQGETLSATLRATGKLDGLQMRMRVEDDLGRILAVPSRPARGERVFSYKLSDFVGKQAFITAELIDERGAIVDQLRAKPLLVVQSERRRKEYTALVSFGGTKHYLNAAQMSMVRAVAADTGFTWGGGIDNSLNIPRGTFGVYWYDRGPTTPEGMEQAIAAYQKTGDFEALGYLTKKELYKRTGDKKFLSRTPSFNDPGFMSTLGDITRATARNKARYNMDYYFVGDEGSLTSYGDPVDFDWSPVALAAFREWLMKEYLSLEALNKKWGTTFKDWNEVVPFTTEEARRAGNFVPWADHRTFMEITFARAYSSVREAVVEGDPEAHIAVSGTQATNSYNGADWYRLDKVIDDFLSYDGGNQWDLHRSFAKRGAMIGFWTGYGSHGLAVQNSIWTAATHNVLHPNIFWMYSFLDPDMTYSKSARDMGLAFKSLRFEGVGKLLMESERQQDGIAIHYSMPSIHAASMIGLHQRGGDDEADGERQERTGRSFPVNRDGWVRAVKDGGLQFDFVAYEQVEQGALASGKYKILILPLSMALSPEELREIEAFVNRGGVVIADAGAGVMDDHCAWQQNGPLDELFGISAPVSKERVFNAQGVKGDITVTSDGAGWKLSAEELAGVEALEPGVKAAGGRALLRIGNTDAVIARQSGKGWAIYLNTLFDRYAVERRGKFGGAGYRSLLNALLSQVGVRPAISVTTPDGKQLTQAQATRYGFGDSLILAVVKENLALEGVAGQDGVTVYNDAGLGQVARQEIVIRLPERFYVTDVRTGKRFGYTDVVKTSVTVGDALVLGLSRSESSLSLSGPQSAIRGEHPSFAISFSKPGRRLVRCHFFGPDGSMIPAYAKNLLLEGTTGKVTLPSALNDAPGRYTLRVADVISGESAEFKIEMK